MAIIVWQVAVVLLIVLLQIHKGNTQQIPFNSVIIFGDSNSDTSNVYNLTNNTWPVSPPYYQGRFTNGPNWVDKLKISNRRNFAYGAGTSDSSFVQGYAGAQNLPTPGVRQQIVNYTMNTNTNTINFEKTLYLIWSGGNDFLYNKNVKPSQIAVSVSNRVLDLLIIGAKYIVVFNQPPSNLIPTINALNQNAYYDAFTRQYNSNLSALISLYQTGFNDRSIRIFDLDSVISNVFTNNSFSSFNKINACWNVSQFAVVSQCSNPDFYVFIDDFHFTTRIHQIIAENVNQFLLFQNSSLAQNWKGYKVTRWLIIFFLFTLQLSYIV